MCVSGADVARMHDDIHNRHEATIGGIAIKIVQTAKRGRPYDRFELFIDEKSVWIGEASSIDPLNIAGGVIEAFVLATLADR